MFPMDMEIEVIKANLRVARVELSKEQIKHLCDFDVTWERLKRAISTRWVNVLTVYGFTVEQSYQLFHFCKSKQNDCVANRVFKLFT